MPDITEPQDAALALPATVTMLVTVGEKDEPGPAPTAGDVAGYATDLLTDHSKHEAQISWRINRVEPAPAGQVLVDAGDLRDLIDLIDPLYLSQPQFFQLLRLAGHPAAGAGE